MPYINTLALYYVSLY